MAWHGAARHSPAIQGKVPFRVQHRALSAYYATGGDELPTSAKVQELRGLNYAVLRRGSKVVACYRVRNDGKLKRMIRIPPGI